MSSNKDEVFVYTFNFVIAALVCTIFYFAWVFDSEFRNYEPEPVTVASGMVQDKRSNSYSCGSKGRRTCTTYYLVIDNTAHVVSESAYTFNSIGDTTTLVRSGSKDKGQPALAMVSGISFAFTCVMLCILVLYIVIKQMQFVIATVIWTIKYRKVQPYSVYLYNLYFVKTVEKKSEYDTSFF